MDVKYNALAAVSGCENFDINIGKSWQEQGTGKKERVLAMALVFRIVLALKTSQQLMRWVYMNVRMRTFEGSVAIKKMCRALPCIRGNGDS